MGVLLKELNFELLSLRMENQMEKNIENEMNTRGL